MAGFEPAAPRSQSECATKLRHTPRAEASAYGRRGPGAPPRSHRLRQTRRQGGGRCPKGTRCTGSRATSSACSAGRSCARAARRAASPSGAARIDGHLLNRAEAYGKHLFHHYTEPDGPAGPILHVHLGLYGKFRTGRGEPPEPRGALRLRLANDEVWADLRGAIACEVVTPEQVEALVARFGPDPLRPRPDGTRAFARVGRSRAPIAGLLMDQSVLAGVGNVYRAELLFRHRLDPFRAGRTIDAELLAADVGRPRRRSCGPASGPGAS